MTLNEQFLNGFSVKIKLTAQKAKDGRSGSEFLYRENFTMSLPKIQTKNICMYQSTTFLLKIRNLNLKILMVKAETKFGGLITC
jgi:hypothetical protein